MANAKQTPGQSVFGFGIDPTARVLVDSTKFIDGAAEAVGGFPVALIAATQKLHTIASAAGDQFYGALSSDINKYAGRVGLGEFEAKKANAELIGRYTIRRAKFTDSDGDEVTAVPFCDDTGGASFPVAADVGKNVHVVQVTVADADDAFNTTSMLKWVVEGGSTSVNGFEDVAKLVNVSDDGEEVELALNQKFANYANFTT